MSDILRKACKRARMYISLIPQITESTQDVLVENKPRPLEVREKDLRRYANEQQNKK